MPNPHPREHISALLSFWVWTQPLSQSFCLDTHWEARTGIIPGLWGLLTQGGNCQVNHFVQYISSSLVESEGKISWRSILKVITLALFWAFYKLCILSRLTPITTLSWWKHLGSQKLKSLFKFTPTRSGKIRIWTTTCWTPPSLSPSSCYLSGVFSEEKGSFGSHRC